MERVFGLKITDHWLDCAADKRRLAEIVTRALVAQPVFSPLNRAMFHCDPHAGNLIYTYDGRLAILDWSLVGHLGGGERVAIAQLILAAIMCDARRIVAVLEKLSTRRHVNRSTLCSVVDNWLRRIRRGQFPGLNWLLGMFDDATQTAQLRLGPDLMMLRKALLTLEGVIDDLGAQGFQSEESLFRQFLIQFAIEWPERWVALPTSRAFATRLSNIDLAATMLGVPLGAARYWQAKWLDILRNNSLATK
jgi:ubiquinone biosynthesis protein